MYPTDMLRRHRYSLPTNPPTKKVGEKRLSARKRPRNQQYKETTIQAKYMRWHEGRFTRHAYLIFPSSLLHAQPFQFVFQQITSTLQYQDIIASSSKSPVHNPPSDSTATTMTIQTGLDYIRSRSIVDCDTMDEQGTYLVPCTSYHLLTYKDSCQNPWSFPRLHLQPGIHLLTIPLTPSLPPG